MISEKAMEALAERARQLKEKRPGYAPLLGFYVKVRELQAASRVSLPVNPLKVKGNGSGHPDDDGVSLVRKEDLPIDTEASIGLFRSLGRHCRSANPHMAAEMEKIDQALADNALDLEELLTVGGTRQAVERAAADLGLDAEILSFLVRSSTRPSFEAAGEQLRGELDLESSRGSHCPVCGSLPVLSVLEDEGGKRYSLCSHCATRWRTDRVSCSACGNREPASLGYFFGEGEEACRIDYCDACHHYIKTIDCRMLEEADPLLEDLATPHLDVLAVQRGYARTGAPESAFGVFSRVKGRE